MAETADDDTTPIGGKLNYPSLRLPAGFAERFKLPADVAQQLKALAQLTAERGPRPLTSEVREVLDFVIQKRRERQAIAEVLRVCEPWLEAHGVDRKLWGPVLPVPTAPRMESSPVWA